MKKILDLFCTFFKIGLFTFGGGYAMISTIRETIVEKKQWITDEELMQVITIAESTPGPIAINMATYVGYKKGKILGSVLATLGVVLPSFIIIYLISLFFEKFLEFKIVKYAFVGINAAVAFLIIKTGYTLLMKLERKILPVITFLIVFILMILFDIFVINFSSVYYIIIGGALGIIYYAIMTPKREVK